MRWCASRRLGSEDDDARNTLNSPLRQLVEYQCSKRMLAPVEFQVGLGAVAYMTGSPWAKGSRHVHPVIRLVPGRAVKGLEPARISH